MNKILSNPALLLIARIVLGLIFIIASAGKIYNPAVFAQEISNYDFMPYFTINLMAIILPWIELIAGIFLISGIRLKASSAIIGALLIVFIIAVATAMARGLNINCGCYSHVANDPVGWKKIIENTIQLALALWIYIFPVKKFTFENFIMNNSRS